LLRSRRLKVSVKGNKQMKNPIVSGLTYLAAFLAISPLASAITVNAAAPAPLLAAGIPAFLAVGGGALISRLRNRKK
jgi:hypothetical protein